MQNWSFRKVVLIIAAVLAIPLLLGLFAYGPKAGALINFSAIATPVFNQKTDLEKVSLPIYHIEIPQENLDSLNKDLPHSGRNRQKATFIENGIKYPVKFRYRGLIANTHWMGKKKSFRVYFGKTSPFGKLRMMNFINPKAYNMINNHLAMRIGKKMGVAVPENRLVYVVMNDEPYGVTEAFEQITGNFEQLKNLSPGEVPVYKGDFASATDTTRKTNLLYKDASIWEYKSEADNTKSNQHLEQLIAALNSPIPETEKWAEIEKHIDVKAFTSYYASLKVLNTLHIDQYHNQWLVLNPRTDRFYPILWDPLMHYGENGEAFYMVYDALCYHILSNPEWRCWRDEAIYAFIQNHYESGKFKEEFDDLVEKVRPAIYGDPNKTGVITSQLKHVFPYSNLHFESSVAKLERNNYSYWDKLLKEISGGTATQKVAGNTLEVAVESNAPVQVVLGLDSLSTTVYEIQEDDSIPVKCWVENGQLVFNAYSSTSHVDGENVDPFQQYKSLNSVAITRKYQFVSPPKNVEIKNAITGQPL